MPLNFEIFPLGVKKALCNIFLAIGVRFGILVL